MILAIWKIIWQIRKKRNQKAEKMIETNVCIYIYISDIYILYINE